MGQRKKQYINSADQENALKDISLIKGDADRALMSLFAGDYDQFIKDLEMIRVRATYSLQEFKKTTKPTFVRPQEHTLLENMGFIFTQNSDGYVDYNRVVKGFGETNDDRLERVTFSAASNHWYAVIEHKDVDGNTWYSRQTSDRKSLRDVLKQIAEEREMAPKQKKDLA